MTLGIQGSMEAVAAAIIANTDATEAFENFTFTALNVQVIDEEVFRNIETSEDPPDYGFIIDFGGSRPFGAREFASSSMEYDVYANFYHLVPGNDEYMTAYTVGIAFLDAFVLYISQWPMLGGQVSGARILGMGTPVPYHRGTQWYVMMDARVGVIENIS